jgi:hypothetical protein
MAEMVVTIASAWHAFLLAPGMTGIAAAMLIQNTHNEHCVQIREGFYSHQYAPTFQALRRTVTWLSTSRTGVYAP